MSHTYNVRTTPRLSLTGVRRVRGRLHPRWLQADRLEDRRMLSGYPLDSIPALHGNPAATASLYLDLDGHFESVRGSYTNINASAC